MKLSLRVLLVLLLFVSFGASAQDFDVPDEVPSTKEQFTNSEKDMIAAANGSKLPLSAARWIKE
jgi:hypothetical protein